MLLSFIDYLLLEIIFHLHPLDLVIVRIVCRRLHLLINHQSTAIWLFRRRYGTVRIPTNNISLWDIYFLYPGGERYRSLKKCYREALENIDIPAITYFEERIIFPVDVIYYHLVSLRRTQFVTREQVIYTRKYVRSTLEIKGFPGHVYSDIFRRFGFLLGCCQDDVDDIYQDETQGASVRCDDPRKEYLIGLIKKGYIIGLIRSGYDKGYDLLKETTNIIDIYNEYKDYFVYNPRFDELKNSISIHDGLYARGFWFMPVFLPVERVMDYPIITTPRTNVHTGKVEYTYLDILVERKRGLDKYLIDKYSHLIPHLKSYTPRLVIWRAKNMGEYIPIGVKIRLYQDIIYYGDWEILDDFLTYFAAYNTKERRGQVARVRRSFPKYKHLTKPLYRLVEEGNIRRIQEIIARSNRLHIIDRQRFYTTLFHTACREGRKDLVEFCFPYLRRGTYLPLPRKTDDLEMRRYLLDLRKEYKSLRL